MFLIAVASFLPALCMACFETCVENITIPHPASSSLTTVTRPQSRLFGQKLPHKVAKNGNKRNKRNKIINKVVDWQNTQKLARHWQQRE